MCKLANSAGFFYEKMMFFIFLIFICNAHNVTDPSTTPRPNDYFPCDGKTLIGYDRSAHLTNASFYKQRNFLLNSLLNNTLTQFDNLAIFSYTNQTELKTFGEFENTDDVASFVYQHNQTSQNSSLCDVFSQLLPFYKNVTEANAIIFVSYFPYNQSDCNITALIRGNFIGSVTFVVLDEDNVNVDFLGILFEQADFIFWEIEKQEQPGEGWQLKVYESLGCGSKNSNNSRNLGNSTLNSTVTTTQKLTTQSSSTTEKAVTTERPTPTVTVTSTIPPPFTPNLGFYLSIIIPLLVSFFAALCVFFYLYHRQQLQQRHQIIKELVRCSNKVSADYFVLKSFDAWEIRQENVLVNYAEKLGAGASANVHVGKLIGDAAIKNVYSGMLSLSKFRDCVVAVKSLPLYADDLCRSDFQQEINFMKSLKYHVHLVSMLGFVQGSNQLLVLEYCENGDLLKFVRANKKQFIDGTQKGLKIKNLVSFSWQISKGLEHLNSLGLIHRDVAARNILLNKDNICKIGDFGLCRRMNSQIYTSKSDSKLPIRWMSPESLKFREYTTKSDVWSYSVLLYELFSLGEIPYANLENSEILSFLESGKRLQKPAHGTEEIYEIMTTCWREDPNERPTFTQICRQLISILDAASQDYGYVNPVKMVQTL